MKKVKIIILLLMLSVVFSVFTSGIVFASSERWVQKYEVNVPLYNDSFVQTSDGGYAIAGRTESGALLLKTDSYGNVEWNQTYLGDGARSIIETSDGGYALAGGTQLIKTDVYGNIEWDRTLLGGNRVNSLIQTSDGGYVATGFSGDSQQGEENYFWLVKTDRL
ncbi:hypothetical protein GH146_04890, partial [archaeon]|nr:hypothetical protein [archaeon]